MKRKSHLYYITPLGVLSFTKKYVFINGVKTKSSYKIGDLLRRFNPKLFSWQNQFLYGCNSYEDLKWTLYRYIRCNDFGENVDDDFRVTCVSDSFCHKASDIFHGQYCDWPLKYVDFPF